MNISAAEIEEVEASLDYKSTLRVDLLYCEERYTPGHTSESLLSILQMLNAFAVNFCFVNFKKFLNWLSADQVFTTIRLICC